MVLPGQLVANELPRVLVIRGETTTHSQRESLKPEFGNSSSGFTIPAVAHHLASARSGTLVERNRHLRLPVALVSTFIKRGGGPWGRP